MMWLQRSTFRGKQLSAEYEASNMSRIWVVRMMMMMEYATFGIT
jgi:hypothetical protein